MPGVQPGESLPFSCAYLPPYFSILGEAPGSGLDGWRLGIRLGPLLAHLTNSEGGGAAIEGLGGFVILKGARTRLGPIERFE